MTLCSAPLLLTGGGVPAGDVPSGAWAMLHWLAGAAVWLLDHGLLVALAAGAAAWIAWQAHQREMTRIEERRDAADARIAGLAFVVGRTLAKSLEEGWKLNEDGFHQGERARELQTRFDAHEPRVEAMMAEATGASGEVAADVKRVARLFWNAAGGVNDMAAFEPQHFGHEPSGDVFQGYREAKSTAENCVEILRRLDAPIRDAEG